MKPSCLADGRASDGGFSVGWHTAAKIGASLVFVLAAGAHFFASQTLVRMLPPFVPRRLEIVYVSGVLELLPWCHGAPTAQPVGSLLRSLQGAPQPPPSAAPQNEVEIYATHLRPAHDDARVGGDDLGGGCSGAVPRPLDRRF